MVEIDKGIPQIGMRFTNPYEAWVFWVAYIAVARGLMCGRETKNVSKTNGEVTSCTFSCSSEDLRKMDNNGSSAKAY
jgi:hypothetical protein